MIHDIYVVGADRETVRAGLIASGLFRLADDDDGTGATPLVPLVPGAGYEDHRGQGVTPPPVTTPGDPPIVTPAEVTGYHCNAWCADGPACTAARAHLAAAGLLVDPEPDTPWCRRA